MCFGLDWLEHVFILVIVVVAVVALIQLLIAFILPRLSLEAGIVAFIVSALRIILWAVVCIAAVYFIFELIACLLPYAGSPRLGR